MLNKMTTVKDELLKMRKRIKALEDRVASLEEDVHTNVDDLKEQVQNTPQGVYKTFGGGASVPQINSGKSVSIADAMQQHRSIFQK